MRTGPIWNFAPISTAWPFSLSLLLGPHGLVVAGGIGLHPEKPAPERSFTS
jgi:hypothetical protein